MIDKPPKNEAPVERYLLLFENNKNIEYFLNKLSYLCNRYGALW